MVIFFILLPIAVFDDPLTGDVQRLVRFQIPVSGKRVADRAVICIDF